ncbi:MAG: hypothetical protein WHS44_02435 [Fimbriimonadales bacterium]|nr:MAG: hypothetical protein KatS3mg018_2049 [Fimbriimonadales bacterium]
MKGLMSYGYCTVSCTMLLLALATPSFSQRAPLDAPTIACLGSTETTITVRVCAGASGASGGFSLQWIKKSDWEAGPDGIAGTEDDYSWPLSDDPRICKASFSGQANGTLWNLGPNECRDITVGSLGDWVNNWPGFSTTCPGALECGTEYVFRAFAHNEPGKGRRGRSDFSADAFCATAACPPTNEYPACCTYSQGYYQNGNFPERVPESCLPITLGNPAAPCRSLTFSTVAAVQNFLGGGGPSRQIQQCGPDRQRSDGGTLARQTLTLVLNLCQCPELADMVLCGFAEGNTALGGSALTAEQAACLNGKTIREILEAANTALGTGNVLCGLSFGQLNQLVEHLNFVLHDDLDGDGDCDPSAFALAHLKRSCP